jgi:hypothetical protein
MEQNSPTTCNADSNFVQVCCGAATCPPGGRDGYANKSSKLSLFAEKPPLACSCKLPRGTPKRPHRTLDAPLRSPPHQWEHNTAGGIPPHWRAWRRRMEEWEGSLDSMARSPAPNRRGARLRGGRTCPASARGGGEPPASPARAATSPAAARPRPTLEEYRQAKLYDKFMLLYYQLGSLEVYEAMVSWYFGDSSHGDGLIEGLDGMQRRVRLKIVLLGHQRLPMFRALHSRGYTPTSCLFLILGTRWLTRLLELYCLEVEEEEFDLPSLRVQAPLYRRGPGYSLGVRLPGSSVAVVLTWAPPSSGPLSGRRPLYKVPFPLGPACREHMPPALPRILSWRRVLPVDWWRPSVAGITLVSCLCRSCRGHATFGKASVGGVSSSSPARASDDEVACRLLPQWWLVSTARWEPQEEGMMSTVASLPSVMKPRFIEPVGESQTSEGDAC